MLHRRRHQRGRSCTQRTRVGLEHLAELQLILVVRTVIDALGHGNAFLRLRTPGSVAFGLLGLDEDLHDTIPARLRLQRPPVVLEVLARIVSLPNF